MKKWVSRYWLLSARGPKMPGCYWSSQEQESISSRHEPRFFITFILQLSIPYTFQSRNYPFHKLSYFQIDPPPKLPQRWKVSNSCFGRSRREAPRLNSSVWRYTLNTLLWNIYKFIHGFSPANQHIPKYRITEKHTQPPAQQKHYTTHWEGLAEVN